MSRVYFGASLKLRFPTASPPRRKQDVHLHVYFADVDLHGSKMTVMVPVPSQGVNAMYPHDTQAQVMGPADLIGDTIFMKAPTVTVLPSNQPLRRNPFVIFKAAISVWQSTTFAASIRGGQPSPGSTSVRCFYEPDNEHLRGLEPLAPATKVFVSGDVTGFDDGVLEIIVHDLSLDPKVPPCNGNILAHPAILSLGQRRAICKWLAWVYPYVEPMANADAAQRADRDISPAVDAPAGAAAAGPAMAPVVVQAGASAGPVSNASNRFVLPVRAPAGAAAAGPAMAPVAVQAGVGAWPAYNASNRSILPVRAPAGAAAAGPAIVPVGVQAGAGVGPANHAAPPAPSTVGLGAAAAGAAIAPVAAQAGAGVAPAVHAAVPVPPTAGLGVHTHAGAAAAFGSRCTLAEEAAIRHALEKAFAFRDEGPIGQTPVRWGNRGSASWDSEPSYDSESEEEEESESSSNETKTPYSKAQASTNAPVLRTHVEVRKPSFAVGYDYEGHEVIDLTGDSSDDEDLFSVRV